MKKTLITLLAAITLATTKAEETVVGTEVYVVGLEIYASNNMTLGETDRFPAIYFIISRNGVLVLRLSCTKAIAEAEARRRI